MKACFTYKRGDRHDRETSSGVTLRSEVALFPGRGEGGAAGEGRYFFLG